MMDRFGRVITDRRIRPRELVADLLANDAFQTSFALWNIFCFFFSIIQYGGPKPLVQWSSPFLHLMYFTAPTYWIIPGLGMFFHWLGPALYWFFRPA